MFPELEEEFNKSEWTSLTVPLQEEYADENDNLEYIAEFDYPYGTYTAALWFREQGKTDEEFKELKLDGDSLGYFIARHTPQPISEAEQKSKDEEEEKENKKKEQDAR